LERAKIYDLESSLVDPLDNLIGFYSVVGKKPSDGVASIVSQGVAGIASATANSRTSGVTSALCVRSSELTKNTAAKKTVTKKISNAHQMASAGSGSESATMIKAFA
jgi:hypothetical protein